MPRNVSRATTAWEARSLDTLDAVAVGMARGASPKKKARTAPARTLELLVSHGMLCDSSMMGDDFTPYYCRVGDQAPKDSASSSGPTEVVELPFTWGLDDFVAFEHIWTRNGVNPGIASPSRIYDVQPAGLGRSRLSARRGTRLSSHQALPPPKTNLQLQVPGLVSLHRTGRRRVVRYTQWLRPLSREIPRYF